VWGPASPLLIFGKAGNQPEFRLLDKRQEIGTQFGGFREADTKGILDI